jgi:hypothetical protein
MHGHYTGVNAMKNTSKRCASLDNMVTTNHSLPVNNQCTISSRTRGNSGIAPELQARRINKIANLHQSANRRVAGSNPARGATHIRVHPSRMCTPEVAKHTNVNSRA